MARNFYEFQEELEKTNNPYRNTEQMTHGVYVSPYQKFKQQYPEFDAWGNKVLRGGYFKDNIRRFAQAGRNARLELQGQQPETEDNLLDFFAPMAMTAGKLPMDEISRMARAKDMGFGDKDWFHGTQKDFDQFSSDKPAYFSPDEHLANRFSQMLDPQAGSSRVMKTKLGVKNTFDFRSDDHLDILEKELDKTGGLIDTDLYGKSYNKIKGVREGLYNMVEDEKVQKSLKNLGYDSFYIREVPEASFYYDAERKASKVFSDTQEGKKDAMSLLKNEITRWKKYGQNVTRIQPEIKRVDGGFKIEYQGDIIKSKDAVDLADKGLNIGVLDNTLIRSNNAKFDPREKASGNLLAGGLLGAIGLGAYDEQR